MGNGRFSLGQLLLVVAVVGVFIGFVRAFPLGKRELFITTVAVFVVSFVFSISLRKVLLLFLSVASLYCAVTAMVGFNRSDVPYFLLTLPIRLAVSLNTDLWPVVLFYGYPGVRPPVAAVSWMALTAAVATSLGISLMRSNRGNRKGDITDIDDDTVEQ